MSSVLGHGLASMSLWALARRAPALAALDHWGWTLGAAAAGCLPDLDSLAGLPHRGPTHTIGFALGISGLAAGILAVFGRAREARCVWPVLCTIVWLHPLMDLLTGGGAAIRVFEPFWHRSFDPVAGCLPLHGYTTCWSGLAGLFMDPGTLRGMLVEAAIFGPGFAATQVRSRPLAAALALTGAGVWAWPAISGTV